MSNFQFFTLHLGFVQIYGKSTQFRSLSLRKTLASFTSTVDFGCKIYAKKCANFFLPWKGMDIFCLGQNENLPMQWSTKYLNNLKILIKYIYVWGLSIPTVAKWILLSLSLLALFSIDLHCKRLSMHMHMDYRYSNRSSNADGMVPNHRYMFKPIHLI